MAHPNGIHPSDAEIVKLYFSRDESAVRLTAERYQHYCHTIAASILSDRADVEECVNDTWLRAWNSIPPASPADLGAYLSKITRHLALDRLSRNRAAKRGGQGTAIPLEELADILTAPDGDSPADALAVEELSAHIDRFLRTLPARTCDIFVLRYFSAASITAISARYHMGENHVSVILRRTRQKLKKYLQERGYEL